MPQIHREEVRGAVIRREEREITPVARATRLVWRGGALEWHHPLAVEVAGDGGKQRIQRVAIHDMTRRVVLGMALAALLGAVALAAITRWARPRQHSPQ